MPISRHDPGAALRPARRNPSFERRQGAPFRPYSYVPTSTGFLYLAIVLDGFSRKVLGWTMANLFVPSWCSRR